MSSSFSPRTGKGRIPAAQIWALLMTGLALLFAAGGDPLGGSLLFIAGGLAALFHPPLLPIPRSWKLLAGALLFWLLLSFVPGTSAFSGGWREEAQNIYGLSLPSFLTAQPWITLETMISVMFAVGWFFYCCVHSPDTQRRRPVLRVFGLLFILFGGLCLFVYYTDLSIPGWKSPKNLGPFENRNQLSSVVFIGLLMTVALLANDFKRHKIWSLVWVLGGLLLLYLLVLNYSRAGIVLLFAGGAAWASINFSRDKNRGRWAVLFLVMSLMLSLFLVFGGATLSRFERSPEPHHLIGGTRAAIQHDAWSMIKSQPVMGVGLGNFTELFPQYRERFQSDAHVRHPESDWLWFTTETGLVGLILMVGLVLLWLRRVFPLSSGSDKHFRSACMVGALMVLCHGLVDVPLHRTGVLVPFLFLASLALPAPTTSITGFREKNAWRGLGMLSLVWGLIHLGETVGLYSKPGDAQVQKVLAQLRSDPGTTLESNTVKTLDAALLSAPLSWELYFARASALLNEGDIAGARDDFRRVRFLEKTSAEVALQESLRWMPVRPDLAIAAAGEMLQRSRYATDVKYGLLYDEARRLGNQEVLEQLPLLSRHLEGLDYLFLPAASEEQFEQWMNGPRSLEMSGDHRFWALLRSRWSEEKILSWCGARPDWLKVHFLTLSGMWAKKTEFRKAYFLIKDHMHKPPLPELRLEESEENSVRKALIRNPQDYAAAYQVIQWELRDKHYLAAREKVGAVLLQKEAPAYFHYLAALIFEGLEDWVNAYQSICQYEGLRAKSTK